MRLMRTGQLDDQPDGDAHSVHADVSRRKQTSRSFPARLLYEIRIPSGSRHSATREARRVHNTRQPNVGENMDTNTLLIIVVVLLLVGGGGFFYRRRV
jgi:LPXTG-motif cell wall-anchored protein